MIEKFFKNNFIYRFVVGVCKKENRKKIKRCFNEYRRIYKLKYRYRRLYRHLISYKKNKIRVLFPLSNVSKWKVQSLYDLMAKSERYDPYVWSLPIF